MRHRFLFIAALLAAHTAYADDFFSGLVKQAVTGAIQQAVNPEQVVRSASGSGASPAQGSAPAPSTTVSVPKKRATFESGETFYADYIASYWQQPGASGRGDTPSTDAPGHVITKPVFGGDQKQPGVPEMRRKFEAILARVLAHPALTDIRGTSIAPGGGFGHAKGGPMGPAVAGSLTLIGYPIYLDNPRTKRFPDGTYHTAGGEGESLSIGVNDTDVLEDRIVTGTYNGMTVVHAGGGYMLVIPNTDRPVYFTQGAGRSVRHVLNPDLIDPTRPRSDIQFMTVYVGAATPTWSDIARGRVKPTSAAGRFLGVMFNTDWRAVLREVN